VLKPLTVKAVQTLEVATVQQLQVHHPDLADAGNFPDHVALPRQLPGGDLIIAGEAGTA